MARKKTAAVDATSSGIAFLLDLKGLDEDFEFTSHWIIANPGLYRATNGNTYLVVPHYKDKSIVAVIEWSALSTKYYPRDAFLESTPKGVRFRFLRERFFDDKKTNDRSTKKSPPKRNKSHC